MASYWKSQPRKFCEVCKCWIGDNKASIDFHERGKSHQEKKKKQLERIKRQSIKQSKNMERADHYLKQMEFGARKQYLEDLKSQGINVKTTDLYKKISASASSKAESSKVAKPPKTKPVAPIKPQPSPKPSVVRAKPFNPKMPYGKWTVVEKPVESEIETPSSSFKIAETEAPLLEFTEKQAVQSEADSSEPVAFKKRKINSSKNRSIRSRMGND